MKCVLLEDFKQLVDSYPATIPTNDLEEARRALGIDMSYGYSGQQVTDVLYQNIREALSLNEEEDVEKILKADVLNLKSALIYRHVLYDENAVKYLKVLRVIQDSCRNNQKYFPAFSQNNKWEKAVVNSKNFNVFSPTVHAVSAENIRHEYPKDFDIATSVNYLRNKGCEVEVNDSGIVINSGLEGVMSELDDKVKHLGGVFIIRSLFQHLNRISRYSSRFERYFFPREASGLSFDQRPQIPYGLLFNLSLRHLRENTQEKNLQQRLDEIVELAVVVSNGVYGVQHYSFWEFHFQSGETIIEFCTDMALWDSLFSIPQSRPSTAVEICDGLFSVVYEEYFEAILGFTKQEFLEVFRKINALPGDKHSPTVVYHSTLRKALKSIEQTKILKILNLLSHADSPNEKYILPSDYSSIDFGQKPLIKLSHTKFLFVNRSWCAPNFFEALAQPLRAQFKLAKRDFDHELGYQLERLVKNKLSIKAIVFASGDYDVGGIQGECDLLIETDQAILLIEFKKKVLTRKSRAGTDVNILLDLSDSILSAQIQAGRTEIILRERGEISLKATDGVVTTVTTKDRVIERVALTQMEFGSFQDKGVINQFLRALLTHSFGAYSNENDVMKKFDQFEQKRQVWVEQYNRLHALNEGFSRFPFFDCWFMSLPQIMEVIDLSTDNNSFYENFRRTKYVSMNTLDWYKEFDVATRTQ